MVDLIKKFMYKFGICTINQKKSIDEYNTRSENWLVKNNDERVVVCEPLPIGK